MIDKVVGFISGPWGAILGKGMMIMTLVSVLYVAFARYNADVRENERVKMRNAQLEQIMKEQVDLGQKLDNLEVKSEQILKERDAKNDKIVERHSEVTHYIQSPEAQKSNRETSDVIKNTIGMLRDEE